jgi:hypothetical protein
MKIGIFFKRFLCLLLISSTLLITCACAAEDDSLGSDSSFGSDLTETNATLKPFDSKTMVLSGTPSFRIVYSSDYRAQALKIQDKMISLDKSYTIGSGKYSLVLDTKTAADGTPEIIVGNTNRTASKAAKKLISGKTDFYSIYVADNAIAVYSDSKDGVDVAVSVLLKKLSAKDGAVIYNNANGNITSKFEKPQVKPSAQTQTIEKTDINVDDLLNSLKSAAGSKAYSVAVSSTDGIKVASIRNTNAQNTYSVSKVYCVTAIGMLYDEGKIKTSDTIGKIFKDEIKAYGIDESKWANITIHDVMKHNIGFTQGSLLDIDVHEDEWKSWDKDFLKIVLNYKIDGKKSYMYSDAAFYLLSRVVTKISGEKLDVFLKSRLFDKADYKDYRITKCPQGYPIGATQFFLRPDDVVKLGRIYLNGGTYNGKRIISQEWVNKVIENGYELKSSNNGYGKGGMRGQYIYVNFKHNVAVAWLSETDSGTDNLDGKLSSFMK